MRFPIIYFFIALSFSIVPMNLDAAHVFTTTKTNYSPGIFPWKITHPNGTNNAPFYELEGTGGWEFFQEERWGEEWSESWISPFNDSLNRPAGTYIYTLEFSASEDSDLLPGLANLDIQYLVDDFLDHIELNGQTIWTRTQGQDFTFLPLDVLQSYSLSPLWFFTHANVIDTLLVTLSDGPNNLAFYSYNLGGSPQSPSLVVSAPW